MIDTLQQILYDEIPLTQAIGIRVVSQDELSLALTAPLENNLNHKCTAFGGSLYAVSVLSGWGLIHLMLKRYRLSGHIVIQESRTRFLKPVTGDLSALCCFESKTQIETLLDRYRRKGRARVSLEAFIGEREDPSVVFTGRYVIHR